MGILSRLLFRSARLTGATALGRAMRPGAVVLSYHNVVNGPVTAADTSLHMSQVSLHAQLEWLARKFAVVTLDTLHERARAGHSLRGLAAITFDDAYQGTIEHGLSVLRRIGLPATVFVPTAAPDRGTPFWWDVHSVGAATDEARRAQCLEELAGDADAILAGAPPSEALAPQFLPASWTQIAAARAPELRFESHTVTHRTLPRLADAALRDELVRAHRTIEERLGEAPRWLAYPYGRWDARVAAVAQEVGYQGAWTLAGHDVTAKVSWWSAPRLNVPAGISLDAFIAWVSGFAHLRAGKG